MKRILAALTVLLYCNLVWQIMLWCFDVLHPVLSFLLILAFPIAGAIGASYLIYWITGDDNWMLPILVSAVLFPALFGFAHFTRTPDYVRYVHSGGDVFRGDAAGIDRPDHVYYEIYTASISAQEFGVAYDSTRPRQSTTTYYKYFAVPIRDARTGTLKDAFLCGWKRGGIPIDEGAGGSYGIEESGVLKAAVADPLYARKISEMNCTRAAQNYYKKTGQSPAQAALILELESESAHEYYASARLHFWIMAAVLNAIFITLLVFVYRAERTV